MGKYSSKPDTLGHIDNVRNAISIICVELTRRGWDHDESKLKKPELKFFDKYTPLLKTLKYGTPEYQASLDALKPALDHHYKKNRHHPEHFGNGVDGMNLIDIIEMFCDWYAASKRTKDGDFGKSIDISCQRFKIGEQLRQIFFNTKKDLNL